MALCAKFRIFSRRTVACRLTLVKLGFSGFGGDKRKLPSDIDQALEYLNNSAVTEL